VRWTLLLLLAMGCGGAARRIPTPTLPQATAPERHSPPPKSLQHYALAVLSWQDGDRPQAQEHLGIALLFDPQAAWLHTTRGRLDLEMGELDDAREAFTRAIHLEPTDPRARLLLSRVLEVEGDYAAAVRQLETLLLHHHDDHAAWSLAQLHLMLGEPTEAAAVLDAWCEHDPSEPIWRRRRAAVQLELGRPHDAWDELARLLEVGIADGPSVDLLMEATHQARRYGSALTLLERVVGWEPGNEEMVVRLGGLAEQARDHQRAVEAWEQLHLLRGGEDPSVLRMVAQARFAAGQPDHALEALDRSEQLDPEAPPEHDLRARALFEAGQQDQAIALIEDEDAWDQDPNLLLLHAELMERAERLDEARDSLRQAMSVGPSSWIIAHALAPLEARTGGLEAALTLIEQHPDPLTSELERLLSRAQLHREAGADEAAMQLVHEASQRWPDLAAPASLRVGWLRADDDPRALTEARAAVARVPGDPGLTRQLALLEIEAGAPERARELLRGALAAHPDHAHLLNDLAYLETEAGTCDDAVLAMARRAVDQRPASGAFTDTLGWVLWCRGDRDEALATLTRAARLDPDDPVIAEHLSEALAGGAADGSKTR